MVLIVARDITEIYARIGDPVSSEALVVAL